MTTSCDLPADAATLPDCGAAERAAGPLRPPEHDLDGALRATERPWIPDKHLVWIGESLYHLTPLPGGCHLARWSDHHGERLQEVPTSMAAMRFPALVAFPGLIENLFDDHLPGGAVRPWSGSIEYGASIDLESDLAGVLSICTRLVLREEYPGSSMRVRASNLALDWAEDRELIPDLGLPERCADPEHHRLVMQTAAVRLLNGRTETGELDQRLGAPIVVTAPARPRRAAPGEAERAPAELTVAGIARAL